MELRFSKRAAWHPTGLKITVDFNDPTDAKGRVFARFESLNPEQGFGYCGSRWEIIRLGLWIALRALLARS